MNRFSRASLQKLATCNEPIIAVAYELIKLIDFTVVCGFRSEKAQNEAFESRASKVKWPNSRHNKMPSGAIDIAPYVDGISESPTQCAYLAGLFVGIAHAMGYNFTWGGDWDHDGEALTDQTFQDLWHLQYEGKREG